MLKTSEFWMTLLAGLLAILVNLQLVSPALATTITNFLPGVIAYILGRLVSKGVKAALASPTDAVRGIGKMVLVAGLGLALSSSPAHALSARVVPSLSVWGGVRDGKALVSSPQAFAAAQLGWNLSNRIGLQATAKRPNKGGNATEYEARIGLRIF